MKRLLALGLFSLICDLCIGGCGRPDTASSARNTKAYTVDLSNRRMPGFKCVETIALESTVSTSLVDPGRNSARDSEQIRISIQAATEVLEIVNARAAAKRFTIRSARATLNGKEAPSPAAGSVVESRFTTGSSPIPKTVPRTVDDLVPFLFETTLGAEHPDLVNDIEMFRIEGTRRLGERWDIDLEGLRASLTAIEVASPDTAVSGYAELRGIVNSGGVDCLEFVGHVEATNVLPRLPKELVLDHAKMETTYTVHIPIDDPTKIQLERGESRIESTGKAFESLDAKRTVVNKGTVLYTYE